MRARDQLVEPRAHRVVHAELREIEPAGLLVEQAQHDALAVPGRDRRDAHVDRAARDAQADAAVLRQALLGDVELRHDLDAADHGVRDRLLRREHFAQHAVDAEAHDEAVLVRLDVDVGRAFLDRLGQQRVDQSDDRRVVVAFEQVVGFGQFVGDRFEIHALVEIGHHRARVVALLVQIAQQALEFVGRHRREAQRRAEMAAQFGEDFRAHAFAADDLGVIVAPAGQRDAVPARVAEARGAPDVASRSRLACRRRRRCRVARRASGLARKSCTSGSNGRRGDGVIGQFSWRICNCSVRR